MLPEKLSPGTVLNRKHLMKPTYLATTGNSNLWDLSADLLLLGAWCKASKENRELLKAYPYEILPYPWEPRSQLVEALQYVYGIYDTTVNQLAKRLNHVHGVLYPVQSWRILLAPWLLQLVCIVSDRYLRLKKALEISPDFMTHILPQDRCDLSVSTTDDFFAVKMQRDDYNLKLISVIARQICPENVVEKDMNIPASQDLMVDEIANGGLLRKWKHRIKEYVCRWNVQGSGDILLSDMYHLSLGDELALNWKTRGALRFIHFEFEKRNSTDNSADTSSMRKALEDMPAEDEFCALVNQLIPLTIPDCYVEGFTQERLKAGKVLGEKPVRWVGSAIGWSYNENVKFLAAEAVSRHGSTVEFQHGGGYGLHEATTCEELSFENDMFFSWGWNYGHPGKIQPLPSPHLSKLKDTHKPTLNKMLFVGVFMLAYDNRLMSWLLSGDKDKYFDDKKAFFNTLIPELQENNFLYRPYVFMNWGEVEWMRQLRADMPMANKGSSTEWMKKSKLVVIDHPHTSFLEALVINVPTVLFWDHNVYRMRKESEKYFDLLREAGILYETPGQAAAHINAIYANPGAWWQNPRVQVARKAFCEHYAFAKKDWIDDWVKALTKLGNQDSGNMDVNVNKMRQTNKYECKH